MKTRNRLPVIVVALVAGGLTATTTAAPAKPNKLSREHRAFFEKKIRLKNNGMDTVAA